MYPDISRRRFDAYNDRSAVLLQQGRVLIDSDFNELVEILDRRTRAETNDIIGRAAVPSETPDGFKVTESAAGQLMIGPGRIYVHGLLAENHGATPVEFDPVLAELRGTTAIAYDDQPYLPDPTGDDAAPTEGGPHLVYLDVWQREITWLEQPDLLENAVGVDSTTRWQTVWQVRVLENVGNITCATPDDQVPGWLDVIRPSEGRISTAAAAAAPTTNPCLIPPSGGYRGLENRLYRVEIHDGGVAGTATFKWARHNASIATTIREVNGKELTVDLTARDAELRFSTGDWVEITDDHLEFARKPGLMRRITNVSDGTRTITINADLDPGVFAVNGADLMARHTRVRLWNQAGQVATTSGVALADLNAAGSDGVIPVPNTGLSVILEDGVQVTFDTPAAGEYCTGDFWVFAARVADASVEEIDEAAPRGIHHHYCRLGVWTPGSDPSDCRVIWPPEFGHEGCDCSVCVSAESHNNGTLTIQQAIDQVAKTGGTVCLGAGIYNLARGPINVNGVQSVRLRGQGWKTILVAVETEVAVIVQNSIGFTMENLAIVGARQKQDLPQVVLANSMDVTIQRCYLLQTEMRAATGAAIGLGGILALVTLSENVVFGVAGVTRIGQGMIPGSDIANDEAPPLFTLGLTIQDNQMICQVAGVRLDGFSVHLGETRIAGNFVVGAKAGAIVMTGAVRADVFPGSNLDIADNTIVATGGGAIVVGTDETRITGNDIGPEPARETDAASAAVAGIILVRGLTQKPIDHVSIIGNRVQRVRGDGIVIRDGVVSVIIKQNVIDGVAGRGIAMGDDASAEHLVIENNQLLNVAVDEGLQLVPAGISVVRAGDVDISGNTIAGVSRQAARAKRIAGIEVIGSTDIRIAGNRLSYIGPDRSASQIDGIIVIGTFEHVDVTDNLIRREVIEFDAGDPTPWCGVRIGKRVRKLHLGPFFLVDLTKFELLLSSLLATLRPIAIEDTGVRGNVVTASGSNPAVDVVVAGNCLVNDNRLRLVTSTPNRAAAMIDAQRLVCSSNIFERERDTIAAELQAAELSAVVGNVAVGLIKLNGANLPSTGLHPWASVNSQS